MHTTFKRIELEIVAQVLKLFKVAAKSEQPELSSSICLEIVLTVRL